MNKCITILHKNEYIETEYIYFEGEISCHLSLQDNFSVLKINDHEIILSPHISHTKLIEIFNKIIEYRQALFIGNNLILELTQSKNQIKDIDIKIQEFDFNGRTYENPDAKKLNI